MNKRFKYCESSQIIKDMKTGERYFGNRQIVNLLNVFSEDLEYEKELNKKIVKVVSEECPKIIVKWVD